LLSKRKYKGRRLKTKDCKICAITPPNNMITCQIFEKIHAIKIKIAD
jgi:hypothetical protein